LDALKILKERGYSFQCDFVGGETKDIDAKRFAEEVNNRGLNRVAFYKGKKYGKEKWDVFKQSDIFIFPTYYDNECFPLVILEAMAHHLPVVTTNEGGIPDIVENGKNGFICERKNPDTLADCIAVLLNDKNLRRKMGDEGYKILKERYTEEQFEERMLEILNRMTTSSS
jgi:glycosyltransferase involved in cell wall biosynthesis